ncbi:HNH endonuclease signature motif containing protein [Streptomyces thermodiastaticus]
MARRLIPAAERFAEKINKSGPWSLIKGAPGQCWIWQAATNRKGYGIFSVNGGSTLAHRFSYELHVGPIPDGLELDHRCRVRACSNPAHLEPVTHAENVRRGKAGAHYRNRTECPQGHPYDDQNTYRRRNGGRACRQCDRDRKKAANAAKPKAPRQLKTHCVNGHEFTPENTGHTGQRRYCRECSRTASRAHARRKRAEATPITPHTTDTDLERAA